MYPPLVICGPSGIAKSFLLNYLINNYPFKNVLSSMTRAPRDGEVHLIDNEYLSHKEFIEAGKNNEFFIDLEFFGNKYGYKKKYVDEILEANFIPVAIMFTPNIELFFMTYPQSYAIFLMPKNDEFLRERLERRGDSIEDIQKRLTSAANEILAYESNKKFFKKSFVITDDQSIWKVVDEITKYYRISK